MKDQEINIAIAEACGWKDIWVECAAVGIPPDSSSRARMEAKHIPDYCHDLNAMHEAEQTILDTEWGKYRDLVAEASYEMVKDIRPLPKFHRPISLPARQRAEAFLRVKGPWNKQP